MPSSSRVSSEPPSRRRSVTRATVLVTTMVSTTFQIFVLSVLASTLLDEFGLNRFELGLIGSLNTLIGAVTAPLTGRITDRIGARVSSVVSQLMCGVGFAAMAMADSVLVLLIATAILGVPQGWGNPTTNSLIAERVPPGVRGVVTGIKQSGVQGGVVLAGATLPALASAFGWRGAMWTYAGVFTVFACLPFLLPTQASPLPAAPNPRRDSLAADTRIDERGVGPLSLYAFLMGTAGGAIARFLPLFAEEEIGLTNEAAGLVLAFSGFVGIGARIVAGPVAEHRVGPLPLLEILAWIGGAVSVLLMLTLQTGAWLLWPIAMLFAVGYSAWNAVAMLAIILGVEQSQAGRASGTVMFGFLGGLALGSPAAGLIIDISGYQWVWIGSLALAIASIATARYAQTQTDHG